MDKLRKSSFRHLYPVMVIPLILTITLLFGSQWNFPHHEVAIASLAVCNLLAFILTLWWASKSLDTLQENRLWIIKALYLEKERFKLALEGSDTGLWDWNIVTGEVYLSPQWFQMFGYREGELVGKISNCTALVHPDDFERAEELMNLHLQGKTDAYSVECRLRKKSGEWLWVLDSAKVVKRDENGKPLRMVGTQKNITERKRIEAELMESNNILEGVIESTSDHIFVKNVQLEMLHVNTSLSKFLGKSKEELIGKRAADFLPIEVANFVEESERRIILSGIGETVEEEVPNSQGSKRILMVSKNPYRDTEGNIIGIVLVARDITERKKIEFELTATKNLLEAVIDSITDNFFVKNSKLEMLHINNALSEFIGKPKAEIIGRRNTEFFPLEIAYPLEESERRIILSGVGETLEEVIYDSEGKKKILMLSKNPYRDREGNIIGLVAVSRDITALKQAEEAIRIKEETLRTIIDNAPIWIWMADTSGKIKFVNKTLCQDSAIPESKWLNANHYAEIVGPEQAASTLASDAACFSQENSYHQEEMIQFADGELRTLEVIKAKVKNYAGEIIGLIGLGVDITEQKKAREKLVASEAKFRQLAQQEALLNRLASQIRNSLDINTVLETAVHEIKTLLKLDRCLFIWYVPNTDPPAWQVAYEAKNNDLNTHIGYYSTDFTGGLLQKISHLEIDRVDDVSAINDPLNRQFFDSLGYKSILNFPLQTHSGRIGVLGCIQHTNYHFWHDEEIQLLQAVCGQLSIAISQAELYEQTRKNAQLAQAQAEQISLAMSQLQKTQAQLIQAEKMSSLGSMVAGIAHEINNPVSFIFGNLDYAEDYASQLISLVQLYQQEYPQPSAIIQDKIEDIDLNFLLEDLPKLLKSMKMGAIRIRDIVKSLRIFSRLDESEMKTVDIHEGIDSTLMILENRLKAQGHCAAIEVSKTYRNLPLVECYPGQLNQVFMNILANAIDALRNCEVSDPSISISTELVDNYAKIEIADNGCGIPDEIKQRIFDPFFTTKPIGAGTGMGLAISHSIIVEKHKGKLTCDSIAGEETKFIIEIPIQQISS